LIFFKSILDHDQLNIDTGSNGDGGDGFDIISGTLEINNSFKNIHFIFIPSF